MPLSHIRIRAGAGVVVAEFRGGDILLTVAMDSSAH